jgi:site-specific DNA-adenine methylase
MRGFLDLRRRKSSLLSLIPRLGGKYALAQDLADIINWTRHNYGLYAYIEPMGGGARTLLNIQPFSEEYYCEFEKGIANVFQCVANRDTVDEFVERLRKMEVNEETFVAAMIDNIMYNAADVLRRDLSMSNDQTATDDDFSKLWNAPENRKPLKKAMKIDGAEEKVSKYFFTLDNPENILKSGVNNYFLAHWGWNAKMDKFKEVGDKSIHYEAVERYMDNLEKIYDVHMRLAKAHIICGDGRELIKKFINDENALIYADPPYITKAIKAGKEGKSYENDWPREWHVDFAKLLHSCKGKVILSGYDAEEYNILMADKNWTRVFLKELTTSSAVLTDDMQRKGDGKKIEDEFIWINFELP